MSFPSFVGGAFLPDLVYPLQIFDKSAHDLNEVIAPIKGIVMKEILTVWQLAVADWLIIYEKFPLALALSELDSASLIIVVFRFHRGRPPVGKQWSGISWRKPTVVFSWGVSTGCSSSSSSSAPFTCQSTPALSVQLVHTTICLVSISRLHLFRNRNKTYQAHVIDIHYPFHLARKSLPIGRAANEMTTIKLVVGVRFWT